MRQDVVAVEVAGCTVRVARVVGERAAALWPVAVERDGADLLRTADGP